MRDSAIMEIAIHEAAHGVIADALGVEVFEIVADGSEGFCSYDCPSTLLDAGKDVVSVAFVFGKIAVAGEAAAPTVPMSHSDNLHAERALWLSGLNEDFYAVRAAWLSQAKKLTEIHRAKIDLVADALLKCGRLSGDEFRAILEANNATQN